MKVKSRQDLARDSKEEVSQAHVLFNNSSLRRSIGRMDTFLDKLSSPIDLSHSDGVGEVHSWPGVGACKIR